MSKNILFAWLGKTDIKAIDDLSIGMGPIYNAVESGNFDEVCIISDETDDCNIRYLAWIKSKLNAIYDLFPCKLTNPTDYDEIYKIVCVVLKSKKNESIENKFIYHLSPGTPAMAVIWIIIANTIYPGKLIQTTKEQGLKEVILPFNITAEYIPFLKEQIEKTIIFTTESLPPKSAEFSQIIFKSKIMENVINQARKLALFNIPVLLMGESGTGKELFAKAIHSSSSFKDGDFIPVNCGAIPKELIESELFGHKKGSFSGAINDKTGYIEAADNGTLFLDEIGELESNVQVKLLRVLNDGKITKVGETISKTINFRLITATNKNLPEFVKDGNFREDLFHRIAVGVITLPTLKERENDAYLLAEYKLKLLNNEFGKLPNWINKYFSKNIKNLIVTYPWYGNVRELFNTITRAVIWSEKEEISVDDFKKGIIDFSNRKKDIMNQSLNETFNLDELIKTVTSNYLEKAMIKSSNNKSKAAEILGFKSYQKLSYWLKKYNINIDL